MAKVKRRTWQSASGPKEAWQLDFVDRYGKRHREQFLKKRDADARLSELMAETGKGTYRALAQKTDVAAACKSFMRYMDGRHQRGEKVTTTYLKTTQQHIDNYINPKPESRIGFQAGLGGITLQDLTAKRVVQFRDAMRDHGAGIVTTRRVLGTLSRILKHAVESDLAAMNVAKGIRVIGTRDEDSERVTPPSKQDLAKILNAAEPDMALRVRFAAATGLRASEQWALKWKHIDLATATVKVDSRVDAYGSIDTTKSAAGKRTVPLGKALVELLKEYKATTPYAQPDNFVFPDSTGNFTRHTNFNRRNWNPLVQAAEVEPIGWHSLRHFAVSTWIEAGLPLKDVQTLAGHATFQITMSRYGHMFPSDDHKEAFDQIAAALT